MDELLLSKVISSGWIQLEMFQYASIMLRNIKQVFPPEPCCSFNKTTQTCRTQQCLMLLSKQAAVLELCQNQEISKQGTCK